MASTNATGGKDYEVKVFKKDKSPFTRENQWAIQFGISNALLEATQQGKVGDQVAHNGTKLTNRHMIVYCAPTAGPFYKASINDISGYEAYLPGEHTPGHEIYTQVPGMAAAILPRLHEHFAAGTFGAVKAPQVRISRQAWRPTGSIGSFHVYLEIDEEAFAWLKGRGWMSSIGLYVARWEHPPVKGLTGRLNPDEDIKSLKARLLQESSQSASNTDMTLVPEVSPPEQDSRARHVTGEENLTKDNNDMTEEQTEEALLDGGSTEEFKTFNAEFTEEQVKEYLQIAELPDAASTPDKSSRYDTTPPGRPRKAPRRTGDRDVSDSDQSEH